MIKLNIGCGENKIDGFINIDTEESTKPDLVCDIKTTLLPYDDGEVETIWIIHCIEHIERTHWDRIFSDFHRVLKDGGELVIAYPEFSKCADGFINNTRGLKEFFRAALYGRQLYPGDYHVTPMDTFEFIDILQKYGFTEIQYAADAEEDFNTWVRCVKGEKPKTREDLFRAEVFGK